MLLFRQPWNAFPDELLVASAAAEPPPATAATTAPVATARRVRWVMAMVVLSRWWEVRGRGPATGESRRRLGAGRRRVSAWAGSWPAGPARAAFRRAPG